MNQDDWEHLCDLVSEEVHYSKEGHDPENFRGCTHPDCLEAQRLLRALKKLLFKEEA